MANSLQSFLHSLRRKKKFPRTQETHLNRCLTTFDLTTLGIGSTLGLGIYVLAGSIAASKAGPSIILSFLVAAIASLFAGLCYAEFGARVPKAGSAYIYSYITVGECMAFVIGWNLILEYLIGTASVARGYSAYIDSLFEGAIAAHFRKWFPMDIPHFSPYPDFLAFAITITLSVVLIFGVKESTRFNSIFTCVNILIVLYVVCRGAFEVDFHNWNLSYKEVPHEKGPPPARDGGDGGFFPFGISGMMHGAASCFYGFIGFDVIATTGEEALNPQRSIPISISLSLLLVFLAYFGVSGIQTLMWPYYDQNRDAPLPYIFMQVGSSASKWIISVGALCGLSTSLLGAMFPLPRILYAMAQDGLIFRSLGAVNERFQTPLTATILSGVGAALLSMIFDIAQLADMMSIGTLLAYSLVAISVMILRTSEDAEEDDESIEQEASSHSSVLTERREEEETSRESSESMRLDNIWAYFWNLNCELIPTKITAQLSIYLITVICALIVLLDVALVFLENQLSDLNVLACTFLAVIFAMVMAVMIALARQPNSRKKLSFKVPFVPVIPLLSVTINFYLMMKLSVATWIRFSIWMAIGSFIYLGYGIRHSSGFMTDEEREAFFRISTEDAPSESGPILNYDSSFSSHGTMNYTQSVVKA